MSSLLVGIGLIVVALSMVFFWRRPALTLALYAFSIPFGSSFAIPGGIPPPFNTATTMLGGLAGVILITRLIVYRRVNPAVPSSVYLFTVFVALSGITYAWSIEPDTSTRELWILISLLALLVAAAHYLFDRRDLKIIEAGTVAGGALTGLYAIFLLAVGQMPVTGAGVPRFEVTGAGGGEGGDPNITAAALLLPYAIALYRTVSRDRIAVRLIYLAASTLVGLGILLTASRGGLLSTALATVLVLASSNYRKLGAFVIVVGLAASFFVIPTAITERVDNTGTNGRTDIWRIGLLACPTYCPVGSGLGTFADVHEDFFLREANAGGNNVSYQAHNIWLQVAVETGVVSLVVLIAAVGTLHVETRAVAKWRRGGAQAALWSVLSANFFLSSLSFKYFWFALTYATIVVTVDRSEKRSRELWTSTTAGVRSLPEPSSIGARRMPAEPAPEPAR